ncbi:hypothetical protein PCANB_002407 [Pneumocystis canis]|nr:hypothetical protein PCANB_002407 [Pneumocystis canis]
MDVGYEEKMDALVRLKRLIRRTQMLRTCRLKRRCSIFRPFNFVYLQLLNQVIRETMADVDVGMMKNTLCSSVINGNLWSSLEKEKFFKSLSRRSRHNPEDIARDVGSKSVIQVIAYINILEEESQMLRFFSKSHGKEIVSLRHIPAAMEMSDEWIDVEEQEAKKIQQWVDKLQEHQEKLIWGPEWSFLGNKKISEIEMALDFVNESFLSIQEPLFQVSPEIYFLRPKSFIELSERLFFNKNTQSSKKIVLYRTTLRHMYELAFKLTKRLVQAAHFIALSRLRAESSSNFHSQHLIRSKDVLIAVDILGLNRNSDKYWLNLPRRIEMTIFDKTGQSLNFDEVENKLSKIPSNILRRRGKEVYLYDQFSVIKNKYICSNNNSTVVCSALNNFQVSDYQNNIVDLCESKSLLNDTQKKDLVNTSDNDLTINILENFDEHADEDMLMNIEDEFLEALDARKSAINECQLRKKMSPFYKFKKIDIPLLPK